MRENFALLLQLILVVATAVQLPLPLLCVATALQLEKRVRQQFCSRPSSNTPANLPFHPLVLRETLQQLLNRNKGTSEEELENKLDQLLVLFR